MFQGLGAGSVRIFAMWTLTLGVSLGEIQTMSNAETASRRALPWLEWPVNI